CRSEGQTEVAGIAFMDGVHGEATGFVGGLGKNGFVHLRIEKKIGARCRSPAGPPKKAGWLHSDEGTGCNWNALSRHGCSKGFYGFRRIFLCSNGETGDSDDTGNLRSTCRKVDRLGADFA